MEILAVPNAFSHVFSTNDPPDNTLLTPLRSSLTATRALSAEIEKHLAMMQHVKDACTLSIKKHEAAFHLIRSLPDDILLTIFRWHIHSHSETDEMDKNIPCLRLPWTFLQVSRRWRRLALSSPLLWITINVRQCHNNRSPTLDAKWNAVIERSVDCDLVVTIDDGPRLYNTQSIIASLRLLARTTMQWRAMNSP